MIKVQFTAESGPSFRGRHGAVVRLSTSLVPPEIRHTVLLVDRSRSLEALARQVLEDVGRFVSALGENEHATVILFAGHGRARVLAGPTRCDAMGRRLIARAIERGAEIADGTVFSEPLALALAAARQAAGPDTAHNVVLFTDGRATPTEWTVQEEQRRSFDLAIALRAFGASAVSAVGYGVHYDLAFLVHLADLAGGGGVCRHVSELGDFTEAICDIRAAFERTVPARVALAFRTSSGTAGRVLRATPDFGLAGEGGVQSGGLYEGGATYFVELDEPCATMEIRGSVGDAEVSQILDMTAWSEAARGEYARAAGAWAFLSGDFALAAEILGAAGHAVAADAAEHAHTAREERQTADAFRRMFRDRSFIGSGLQPAGPNLCALNVLRRLVEDPECVVRLDEYQLTGLATRDRTGRIVETPERSLRVTGLQGEETRLNFSFRAMKRVLVRPVDDAGAIIPGAEPEPKWTPRNYVAIKDGNLHFGKKGFRATMSLDTFRLLHDSRVIDRRAVYLEGQEYDIDLGGIRLVSARWADAAALGLVPLLREEAELAAEQTALGARLRALGAPTSREREDVYQPDNVVDDPEGKETYEAEHVEVRLMGYNPFNYAPSAEGYDAGGALDRLERIRARLRTVRFLSRCVVFAMHATKSKVIAWDEGKTVARGKHQKLERMAEFEGAKLKLVTWTESHPFG